MKRVYQAANSVEAHMIVHLLEQAGVQAHVQGEHLQSGAGELPVGLVAVAVEDQDVDAARAVIRDWEAKSTPSASEASPSPRYAPMFAFLVGAALSGGGVSSYIPDVGNSQEVTFSTSGGLGEAEVGGPTMNIVPKTGGNQLKGNLYLAGTPRGLVGSNYTSELETAGLRAPGELLKLWDFTAGVGGPILAGLAHLPILRIRNIDSGETAFPQPAVRQRHQTPVVQMQVRQQRASVMRRPLKRNILR